MMTHFQPLSIKAKLILAFLGGMIIPLTFVILYSLYASARSIEERILHQAVSGVQFKAREIESFLKGAERDVIFLSESTLFQDLMNTKVSRDSEEFEQLRKRMEGEFLLFSQGKRIYYQIRYIDERGMEVIRLNFDGKSPLPVPPEKLQDKGDRYYFQETMALRPGQLYISPIDLNIEHGLVEVPHRPVIRYATPVANQLGEQKGIIIINIFAESLFMLIKDLPPEREAFLVDRSGRYLARVGFADNSEQGSFEEPGKLEQDYPQVVVSQILSGNRGTTQKRIASIISYTPVRLSDSHPDRFWILVVGSPKSLISHAIRSELGGFAFVTLATLVGAMSLGLLFARHFSRPLLELCKATEVIAQGNCRHRVKITRRDEIGNLCEKFNLMAERLGEWQAGLQQWNEELQVEVERRNEALRTSEERLAQADKLASLGKLASGVLHEVANPLSAIKTTIQVMEEDPEKEEHHEKYLRRIIREIDRLNRFLKTFASFARPGKPDLKPHLVSDLFREASLLVKEEARKKKVDIEEDHDADFVEFLCDGAQIGQLLLNLILNALDAMPCGGKITIASEIITSEAASDFLRLTISDTGEGIPEEQISKIFTPFFTTKAKGTGLGLSIVHQIVKDHGGKISVISEVGKGTTFVIDFPMDNRDLITTSRDIGRSVLLYVPTKESVNGCDNSDHRR